MNALSISSEPTIGAVTMTSRDWSAIERDLDADGHCVLRDCLDVDQCRSIAAMYEQSGTFRNRIVMARHNFGRGEYQYFAYPLPSLIESLRASMYRQLAPIANRWCERLRLDTRFPLEHAQFIDRCHRAGQTRPTPLLLRYAAGDYNCLHQDMYGEHYFPLQVAILLSAPQREFTGGEIVLTEQRPRMQSRVSVVDLRQGDAVVFAVRERPVVGSKGVYRVNTRHGVSRLASGSRFTLGLIFHDAQ